MNKIAIIMGSKSDFEIVLPCKKILDDFEIKNDIFIMSAHRTCKEVVDFSENASNNGYSLIIAAAGKAAHLAGVIAANTILPVIGIPIKSSMMDGMDSLLSTVQMPSGIPVATVAVNGSENAALLAVEILAINDVKLKNKLLKYRIELTNKIHKDNENLNTLFTRENQ